MMMKGFADDDDDERQRYAAVLEGLENPEARDCVYRTRAQWQTKYIPIFRVGQKFVLNCFSCISKSALDKGLLYTTVKSAIRSALETGYAMRV
jgi:hypothetical protein